MFNFFADVMDALELMYCLVILPSPFLKGEIFLLLGSQLQSFLIYLDQGCRIREHWALHGKRALNLQRKVTKLNILTQTPMCWWICIADQTHKNLRKPCSPHTQYGTRIAFLFIIHAYFKKPVCKPKPSYVYCIVNRWILWSIPASAESSPSAVSSSPQQSSFQGGNQLITVHLN